MVTELFVVVVLLREVDGHRCLEEALGQQCTNENTMSQQSRLPSGPCRAVSQQSSGLNPPLQQSRLPADFECEGGTELWMIGCPGVPASFLINHWKLL